MSFDPYLHLRGDCAAAMEFYANVFAAEDLFLMRYSEMPEAPPVFADSKGKTLYKWPIKSIRNGDVGEQKNKPTCDDTVYKVNAGLMSPYPGGFTLPEVETRPSCLQEWPAVYASADDKPVGKWTVVDRKDGKKQWAYDGFALYTSVLDEVPGDTRGGTRRKTGGDSPAYREPVSPMPNIPAQFGVYSVAKGRILATSIGYSVYSYDKDTATKSACTGTCLNEWAPMLAAENAVPQGDWSILERSPGVKQWAFRKKPLYTRIADEKFRSFEGGDVPGWHNVFTQTEPAAPKNFTVQDTRAGQVLADKNGRTIYIYNCGDDAIDELACDNPKSPQAYRLAICGGGDPDVCNKTFPYVIAEAGAKSDTRAAARESPPSFRPHGGDASVGANLFVPYKARRQRRFGGSALALAGGAGGLPAFLTAFSGLPAFSAGAALALPLATGFARSSANRLPGLPLSAFSALSRDEALSCTATLRSTTIGRPFLPLTTVRWISVRGGGGGSTAPAWGVVGSRLLRLMRSPSLSEGTIKVYPLPMRARGDSPLTCRSLLADMPRRSATPSSPSPSRSS